MVLCGALAGVPVPAMVMSESVGDVAGKEKTGWTMFVREAGRCSPSLASTAAFWERPGHRTGARHSPGCSSKSKGDS